MEYYLVGFKVLFCILNSFLEPRKLIVERRSNCIVSCIGNIALKSQRTYSISIFLIRNKARKYNNYTTVTKTIQTNIFWFEKCTTNYYTLKQQYRHL